MDFSEKWGRSVDEAVDLALKDLKVDKDKVKVIVLEEPSKGFFGIGSKLAKVRVERIPEVIKKEDIQPRKETDFNQRKEVKEVKEANPAKKDKNIETKDNRREPKGDRPNRKREDRRKNSVRDNNRQSVSVREKPANLTEINESPVLDFLKDVTERMGLDLTIKAMTNDEYLYFDISGKDSGTIIGKRGQTLDSIQYLASLVANKDTDKYTRVIVDAENYREKRERTLEQLANRLADKVLKTGKSVRLEPMNPYERKVIHATLQKNPAVTTRSEGEEPYRRVIIEQK